MKTYEIVTIKRSYRKGFRPFVRSLLNRKAVYSVAAYARKASKHLGYDISEARIRSTLKKQAAQGTLHAVLVRGDNGAEYVVGFAA